MDPTNVYVDTKKLEVKVHVDNLYNTIFTRLRDAGLWAPGLSW
jgi:hypothetical protein